MKEVGLLGEKLLAPIQLDVQQHTNKTLSNLRQLLQTCSTLKGTILEVSKKGDVIFTTTYGKFTLPQIPDIKELHKGDKLLFKLNLIIIK